MSLFAGPVDSPASSAYDWSSPRFGGGFYLWGHVKLGGMCNLYSMTRAPDEVAKFFTTKIGQIGNAGGDVYPGYPGLNPVSFKLMHRHRPGDSRSL